MFKCRVWQKAPQKRCSCYPLSRCPFHHTRLSCPRVWAESSWITEIHKQSISEISRTLPQLPKNQEKSCLELLSYSIPHRHTEHLSYVRLSAGDCKGEDICFHVVYIILIDLMVYCLPLKLSGCDTFSNPQNFSVTFPVCNVETLWVNEWKAILA